MEAAGFELQGFCDGEMDALPGGEKKWCAFIRFGCFAKTYDTKTLISAWRGSAYL